MEKEYKIVIDPSMLKILGPNMYKNIYFILGELIANSWDADAKNVYIIIDNNKIILEDDGNGMSYSDGDIKKYLNVGQETRKNSEEALTFNLHRKKMGRKGLGKLAALSLSDPVKILTIKNNEKSGFILTKNIDTTGFLTPIEEKDIIFKKIQNSGTSIIMENPKYIIHKQSSTIAKNIARIFPFVDKNFIIHIKKDNQPEVFIENSKKTIVNELATIITLGKEFEEYGKFVDDKFKRNSSEININLDLIDNKGNKTQKDLIIKGWIGTYKTTKGRKKDILDFQDNFISLYANGKIGEFNILEKVGKNTVTESYVVGELHIDLFEDSDLPDMAISNREGYMTSDLRYQEVLKESRKLLDKIIKLRKSYVDDKNKDLIKKKIEKQKNLEKELIEETNNYKNQIIKTITGNLQKNNITDELKEKIIKDANNSIDKNQKLIGLKSQVDTNKKKLLISHAAKDKFFADLIYSMLIYNDFPKEEILYSSCDDEEARIPQDVESIFEYLRDFFVDSISNKKIHIIYITSKVMYQSWYAVSEVGAGWITKAGHNIFNISNNDCIPKKPLNIDATWSNSILEYDTEKISMTSVDSDEFCIRIRRIVEMCGYTPNTKENNKKRLQNLINIE